MAADRRWVQRNLGRPPADEAALARGLVIPPRASRAEHDPRRHYENFGLWSSVCSAIVCWAIVAGL